MSNNVKCLEFQYNLNDEIEVSIYHGCSLQEHDDLNWTVE